VRQVTSTLPPRATEPYRIPGRYSVCWIRSRLGDEKYLYSSKVYPAMSRAAAVRAFNRDVVEKLRFSATARVNISHVFYHSYDGAGRSPKCSHVEDAATSPVPGFCIDGVTDPSAGSLIPDVAAAVAGAR
jgi:hypothetical protein